MFELAGLGAPILALALLITLAAGVVKGAVGFAMPLIMVSGLSAVIDPKLALAAIIFPITLANGLQTFRQGVPAALAAAQEFWRYLAIVCLAIIVTAQAVVLLPSQVFYLVLGIPVVLVSAMQLIGVRLHVKPQNRHRAEWLVGLLSGILGGLAGTWGPTTVLYLMAIDTPKAKQMVVQGVIYGVGSVTLFAAHLKSGLLNLQTMPLSALLVAPALFGMWLGFKLQDRMDANRFRQVTLVVLTIAGLNLIRKGLMS